MMSRLQKSLDSEFVPAANNVGRPPVSYTVKDAVKFVRYSSRTTPLKLTSWFGKISAWHLSFVITSAKIALAICTGANIVSFLTSLLTGSCQKSQARASHNGMRTSRGVAVVYNSLLQSQGGSRKRNVQQQHYQVADEAKEKTWKHHWPYCWCCRLWKEPKHFSYHHGG